MNTSENPYQTPTSVLDQQPVSLPLTPAGQGRRFLNFIIDYASFMVLSFLFGATLGVIFYLIGGQAALTRLQKVPSFVLGLFPLIGYYLFFEGVFGRTIGKFITGTIVVDENGKKPKFMQIVGRTFSRFIPFEAFSFFGSDPRGWHDSIANTYVVRRPHS